MLGRVEGEGPDVVGISRVADEAAGGMRVQSNHEEEGKVVCIPEGLEALVANLVLRGAVHEHHDEQHEMASDATRLRVVDV